MITDTPNPITLALNAKPKLCIRGESRQRRLWVVSAPYWVHDRWYIDLMDPDIGTARSFEIADLDPGD